MKNYLVFDIGGTEIKYGVINEELLFLEKWQMPSKGAQGAYLIFEDIIEKAKPLICKYKTRAMGISSAGVINSQTGEVLSATNTIIEYIGINVIELLSKALNIAVTVENDVNCVGLAETHFGSGKPYCSVVCLTIGTGIGGSILLNKKLLKGHVFSAGEFGLMHVDGHPFEHSASTFALVRLAQKEIGSHIKNGIEVFKLYDKGNETAIRLVDNFYRNLSVGIANITYALNPSAVIIGGGITTRETFRDELVIHINKHLTPYYFKNTAFLVASFRNDAGMIGAYIHLKNEYPEI